MTGRLSGDPPAIDGTDPRTTGAYVRWLSEDGNNGDVILTGVVHDHPASTYRVRSIVDAAEPDVLALELPPLAVPLFERFATSERTPPMAGGEMSAAIRAAKTDTVVGIDGPTPAFLWRLVRMLRREKIDLSLVRPLATGVLSVTKHAVACRLAATFGERILDRLPGPDSVEHGCDLHDDPRRQAADERKQIRRAEAVMNAFGGLGALHLRDTVREEHMADRLETLRGGGHTVLAVVGVGHLDSLVRRLQ